MAKPRDNSKIGQAAQGGPDANPAPEIVSVSSRRVKCDGGGALGHPVVYYDMGEENFVECLYCDRRFVLEEGGH